MLLFKLKVINCDDYYYTFWLSSSHFLESVEQISFFNTTHEDKELQLDIDSVTDVTFSKFSSLSDVTLKKDVVERLENLGILISLEQIVDENS